MKLRLPDRGALVQRPTRRAAATALLAIASVIGVSGCTQACALPAMAAPAVRLDAAAWLAKHPSAAVTGCVLSQCARMDPGSTEVDLWLPQGTDPSAALTLTVTAAEDGEQIVDDHAQVRLKEVNIGGAKVCSAWIWTRTVDLDGSGQLRVLAS